MRRAIGIFVVRCGLRIALGKNAGRSLILSSLEATERV